MSCIATMNHGEWVRSVTVVAGKFLATGASNCIQIYSLSDFKWVTTCKKSSGTTRYCSISELISVVERSVHNLYGLGELLFACRGDAGTTGELDIWHAESGKLISTVRPRQVINNYSYAGTDSHRTLVGCSVLRLDTDYMRSQRSCDVLETAT